MRGRSLLLCVLVFLSITIPVCRGQKKGYWWLFPNFDNEDSTENGLSGVLNTPHTDSGARNAASDLRSSLRAVKTNGAYKNDRDIKNLIDDDEVVETVLISDNPSNDKKDNDASILQSDPEWKEVDDGSGETILPDDEDESSDRVPSILNKRPDAKEKPGPVSGTPGGQGRETSKTEQSPAQEKGVDETALKDQKRLRNSLNDDDDDETVLEGSGNQEGSGDDQQIVKTDERKGDQKPKTRTEEGSADTEEEFDTKQRSSNMERARNFETDAEESDDTKDEDFEFDGEDGKLEDVQEATDEEVTEDEESLSYSEDGEERDDVEPDQTGNEEAEDSDVLVSTNVPVFPTNSANTCTNLPDKYNLEIESKSDTYVNGSSIQLQCHLRLDENDMPTTDVPNFRLSWIFQGPDCAQGHTSDDCWLTINSSTFNAWNATFTTLVIPNAQHNNSGTYTCELLFECQNSHGDWINSTLSKSIKVYPKPFYGAQMAVILSICFMLLAILIGMYVYTQKKRQRMRAKYDAMVASHKIQITPAKVLDLPNHTVYMPTTTSIEPVKNGSLLSSKSSFSSLSSREEV